MTPTPTQGPPHPHSTCPCLSSIAVPVPQERDQQRKQIRDALAFKQKVRKITQFFDDGKKSQGERQAKSKSKLVALEAQNELMNKHLELVPELQAALKSALAADDVLQAEIERLKTAVEASRNHFTGVTPLCWGLRLAFCLRVVVLVMMDRGEGGFGCWGVLPYVIQVVSKYLLPKVLVSLCSPALAPPPPPSPPHTPGVNGAAHSTHTIAHHSSTSDGIPRQTPPSETRHQSTAVARGLWGHVERCALGCCVERMRCALGSLLVGCCVGLVMCSANLQRNVVA